MTTPNIPVVNAGNSYENGCRISFASVTTLGVAAGQMRDSTDTNDIFLSAPVVINAAVKGVVNGLDIGALANNTRYHVFLIADSREYSPTGGLLSTSDTNPMLPAGYDMFRRIGMVRTQGAAQIINFSQEGDGPNRTMWYQDAIATAVAAGNDAVFTLVDLSASLSPASTEVIMKAVLTPGAAGRSVALRKTGSASVSGNVEMSADVNAVAHIGSMRCPTATIAGVVSVDYKVSNAGDAVALSVYGYVDQI